MMSPENHTANMLKVNYSPDTQTSGYYIPRLTIKKRRKHLIPTIYHLHRFLPQNYIHTATKALAGNFTNRCLRCAFLTWAILIALAVSALMFPKLPDTLGLSEEATGDLGGWVGWG